MAMRARHWLSEPGIVCALGAGTAQVFRALMSADTQGLAPASGWVAQRKVALGAVGAALPAISDELPAHLHSRNNQLLLAAAMQIEPRLRGAVARFGPARVGVVLGTSTSGVNDNAPAFGERLATGRWPPDYDYRRQRLNSPAEFMAAWLGTTGPAYTLSTACTSSARALLSAARLLKLGLCDAVVCGGADALCRLTINGFASLEAISDEPCLPFSANRRGINIGEAGALFLMEREPSDEAGIALLGGAGSSDAWHMSAPEPEGAGARRAMQDALAEAALTPDDIGWLNLHGTGTRLNDAMESRATDAMFPGGVPCGSTKGLTGHALGAAGALEAALCWLVLSPLNPQGRLPAHAWDAVPDPELPALDFSTGTQAFAGDRPRIAMSNSFAFGGNNVSLILGAGA